MRDLQKDLEICNAATPGPWEVVRDWFAGPIWWVKGPKGFVAGCASDEQLARCIAESREGWPEAIKRAMAAEARVKELRWALHELLYAGQCDVCLLDVNGGCRLGLGKEACIKLASEQARQALEVTRLRKKEGWRWSESGCPGSPLV